MAGRAGDPVLGVERKSDFGAVRSESDPEADILSCCRFDGHQVWVFYHAGGGLCEDVNSVASSRSKRSSW